MKFRTGILISWLLGALVLGAAGYVWTGTGAQTPTDDYATAVVMRGDIEDTVSALGALQPREFVDVGTQVSGQLKKVTVSIGDTVKRGDLIAEIDPVVFAAKVEASKATLRSLGAQLEEKRAQHTLATRQYERNASMFKENAVSKDALEISLAARQASAAQIATLLAQQEQTSANLKVEEANLSYTRIYAPISGTVVALVARQGQTLNANQQAPVILRIADLDTMTVVAQVSEADVVRLKSDMNVYFSTLGRPERRWTGKVRQILPTPETINNVVLYNVLFDVKNADRELKMQMSAQVFFIFGQAKNALLVSVAALKPGKASGSRKATPNSTAPADDAAAAAANGKPETDALVHAATAKEPRKRSYMVRVLKDGRLEEREVAVGIKNRLWAQVLSGLADGEEVVLDAAPEPKRDHKSAYKRPAKL
jgi:macrolide-specific efflux system membrane fusion protein